ncbi:unnamed protein product [Boreogadus saida]
MMLVHIVSLLLLLDEGVHATGAAQLAVSSSGWREPLDCVRASELCNQNGQCSSRFRIMRQCLSGGDKERSTMLASKECQGALEVLQDSPLYDCRCKRGMKKELQCLQNYWSIHMGLSEDQKTPGWYGYPNRNTLHGDVQMDVAGVLWFSGPPSHPEQRW